MKRFFESAPLDVIQHIFSFLDQKDLALSVSRLSKRLRTISLSNVLWATLFAKLSGVAIVANQDALEKFVIYYLFQKAQRDGCRQGKDPVMPLFKEVRKKLKGIEQRQTAKDQPWILYIHGEMLCNGYDCEKDATSGFNLLLNAAQLGNTDAMLSVARGVGGITALNQDLVERKKWLIEAVARNNLEAMFSLAKFYYDGEPKFEIEQNKQEALSLLKRAANMGHSASSYFLGEKFFETAERCAKEDLKISSGEKDPDEKRFIDYYFSPETRLERNVANIVASFERFAIEGSTDAARMLVDVFKNGNSEYNFSPDPDKAEFFTKLLQEKQIAAVKDGIFWLEKSMMQRNIKAALKLADYYFYGIKLLKAEAGVPSTPDIDKGLDCLKRAASLGSSHAAYRLACIYRNGYLNGSMYELININLAINWLEHGAKNASQYHSQECASCLAQIYQSGDFGITPDLKKVLHWYNKGAELGSKDCQFQLGILFLAGNANLGLESNPVRAEKEFVKAFYHGGSPCWAMSDKIAEAYYDAKPSNLSQYIKWTMRGILMQPNCLEAFKDFAFKKSSKLYTRLCLDNIGSYENIYSREDYERITTQKVISLVKECYEELNLPVVEDDFLLSYFSNLKYENWTSSASASMCSK
jgi:TPR repeat protein